MIAGVTHLRSAAAAAIKKMGKSHEGADAATHIIYSISHSRAFLIFRNFRLRACIYRARITAMCARERLLRPVNGIPLEFWRVGRDRPRYANGSHILQSELDTLQQLRASEDSYIRRLTLFRHRPCNDCFHLLAISFGTAL